MLFAIPIALIALLSVAGPAVADDGSTSPDRDTHASTIRPLTARLCVGCHGPDATEGDVRLDTIDADVVRGKDTALWEDVLRRIETREMPPKDEPQPTEVERTTIVRWIRGELRKHVTVQRGVPGRVVLRRLSRDEYRNTLRDLLGLDYDIGRSLPPDTRYEGFDHVGEVQELSPSQMETYLRLARDAIDKAIVTGDRPLSFQFHMQPEQGKEGLEWRVATHGVSANLETATAFAKGFRGGDQSLQPDEWNRTYKFGYREGHDRFGELPHTKTGVWLPAPRKAYMAKGADWGRIGFRLPHVPRGDDRLFRLRIKAGVLKKENLGTPLLSIWVFKKHLADVEIDASANDPEWYEFVFAERDLHDVQIHSDDNRFAKTPITDLVLNNGYEHPGAKKGRDRSVPEGVELPGVFVDAVEFETGFVRAWPPEHHRRLLFDSPNADDPEAYAREVLERFMPRAFRRPVREDELDGKLALFRAAYEETGDFVESIREPLVATLVSPAFLFLVEDTGLDEKRRRPLDDHELASRLSYFLWSTMPDVRLLDLAAQGTLSKPDVLAKEVDRLLDDERAIRFHRGFTSQWLGLAKLDDLMIEDERWIRRAGLRNAMREEPARFLGELLRTNASLENLVDSDFAMLNELLARHYGIDDVYGQRFRRVPLGDDSPRGGLLTTAACLTITTDGMITSPIYRGKWILETILDTPPPPAPANVPPLDDAPEERLGLREQLARHREDANCAACHAKIDPVGWPFERYSILGEYGDYGWGENWRAFNDPKRNKQDERPDLHGVLPNGTGVETVADVRRVLLDESLDDVYRSVTRNLMIYTLGRPLDVTDDEVVDEIVAELKKDNGRALTLIHAVVTSRPFLEK